MQKQKRLICVLMKDGTPRRVAIDHADRLLDSGQARRYISRSIYKALRAGIEVKDLNTRNDVALKAQIRKAKLVEEAKAKKPKADKKEVEQVTKRRRTRSH